MTNLHTTDKEAREQAFREQNEDTQHMVHRLRDWQDGDILYGVAIIKSNGSAMGKTYRHNPANQSPKKLDAVDVERQAHKSARSHYEGVVDTDNSNPMGWNDGDVVFLYAAHIYNVTTEPLASSDPGEPPLKHADMEKVVVLDSEYNG